MPQLGNPSENEQTPLIEVYLDDFSRRFSMRPGSLMWFLGAGASAAAGIPTAGDMIWEFKQKLFVSQRRAAPEIVADLSSAGVREYLQSHVDSTNSLPQEGASSEYSALFEAVFPAEADRRAYLDVKLGGAKPSYGHIALASLMKANHTRIVWTTNFDPLVADACAKVFDGTGALTSLSLGMGAELASKAMADSRWPIEVKLHGDFRFRQLKNTNEELRQQEGELRKLLIEACCRSGLVVCGYSGRDDSIMTTLEEAAALPGAFPAGLFWLHRGDGAPYERVSDLLALAHSRDIEAALVRVQSFDEVLRDLVRLVPNFDAKPVESFGKQREVRSAAPAVGGKAHWPVVRLNGLRVEQMPTVFRRVVCGVGGTREVRDAIEKAGVNVIAARTQRGVLAFGGDSDVRQAFASFGVEDFDLAQVDVRRLRYDSVERGLLRDAIVRALCRHRNLAHIRKRTTDLLYPKSVDEPELQALKALVSPLGGTLPKFPEVQWREGCGIRLEWASDSLWLLLEPNPIFLNLNGENKAAASVFGRERTFKRYNQTLDALVNFWANFFLGDGGEVHALGVATGVDAAFKFGTRTAFTRRAGV